jgi:hypothetical protein
LTSVNAELTVQKLELLKPSSHAHIPHLLLRVRQNAGSRARRKLIERKPTAADVVTAAEAAIHDEIATVSQLSEKASKQPYYKWNDRWSRKMQDVVCAQSSRVTNLGG